MIIGLWPILGKSRRELSVYISTESALSARENQFHAYRAANGLRSR